MRSIYMDTHFAPMRSLFVCCILLIPSMGLAFQSPPPQIFHNNHHSPFATTRTMASTRLFLDLGGIFGGKKNRKRDEASIADGKLGDVAQIMETMENLENAQRTGKLTSSILQELRSGSVEGLALDGQVKVRFDLLQRPLRVNIDEGCLAEINANDLAASLTLAMKDGHAKSTEKMEEKLKALYSEFGLSSDKQ